MKKRFEFFIYGCEKHVIEFKEYIKKSENITYSGLGKMRGGDKNYGTDCAFELAGEGFADCFILVGVEVNDKIVEGGAVR